MNHATAGAFCARNMLTRKYLRHEERPSLEQFYRDGILTVSGFFVKPVVLEFDQQQGSSDRDPVLMKAAERRYA